MEKEWQKHNWQLRTHEREGQNGDKSKMSIEHIFERFGLLLKAVILTGPQLQETSLYWVVCQMLRSLAGCLHTTDTQPEPRGGKACLVSQPVVTAVSYPAHSIWS